MTRQQQPRRRQQRPPRRPVFDGDFPDDGEPVTELIARTRPGWDPGTVPFAGASGAGAAPTRTAWTIRAAEPPAARSRRGPALPPYHDARDEVVGRDTAHGWPHLFKLTCQYPAADHATPIPCGRTYADHAARSFRELRLSAHAHGWHLDTLGRWACPRCCQDSPDYRTLYPVMLWDPAAYEADQGGDHTAGFWLRAAVYYSLDADVHDVASVKGRHAAGAR